MIGSEDDTVELPSLRELPDKFFTPHQSWLAMTFGAVTDCGTVRANNEDHYVVMHRSRTQEVLLTNESMENLQPVREEAYVMVVADGMGGARFGELASSLVVRTAWDLTIRATKWIMKMNAAEAKEIRERYEAYAQLMQRALIEQAGSEPSLSGMGTTWTSASITGTDAVIAQVGDSRAYHYRGGSIRQVTRDHTVAQAMIDAGNDPKVARPFRHVLTNCFGGGNEEVRVDVHHVELQANDRLLLCSDGLSDYVSDTEMASILAAKDDPQEACQALTEMALKGDGQDNVTVIIGKCESVED